MNHSTISRSARSLFVAGLSAAALALPASAQSVGPDAPSAPFTASSLAASALAAPQTGATGTAANGDASAPTAAPRSMLDVRASALTLAARDSARDVSRRNLPAPIPRQENTSRTNTALMIVGAAAIVLGAAVGDDAGTVLIIGGAGLGLFGLYRLLH